ncbi:helix-turn-helix domain-containing protein [Streptomyces minutiscleroticus]|nr:helix-turn-helix domain-containing protein [Streptomyces minutiscleroticus]
MAAPRRDTRGIVDAGELFARVRFRRREPAPALRPYLEHYWLIDWDLPEPYASHVVPHPSVNVVFQRHGDGRPPFGEVAGIGLGLFTQKLEGRGRVCGVQFRPGGFRPFAPGRPVADWTGRRLTLEEVFGPPADRTGADTDAGAGTGAGVGTGTGARAGDAVAAVLGPEDEDDEDARVAALDAYLLALGPRPDPQADLAMALVDRIRTDRAIRRVGDFARAEGLSVRVLQRLFAAYVGVGPKWIILRYRIHEALEHAETSRTVDWAALAADLGYADQAHLVRDFTATVGVPPTAYAQARSRRGNRPDRADRPGPADPPDRPLRDRARRAGTGPTPPAPDGPR